MSKMGVSPGVMPGDAHQVEDVMKKIMLAIIFISVIGGVIWGLNNPSHKEPEVIKRTRFLMDTYCTMKVPVYGEIWTREAVDKAINRAFERMEQIDRKFNILNTDSPLYHFNNEGIPITDKEIVNVINIAQEVSRESDGAFDITVEPLVKLWGFFSDNPHLPEKEEIQKTLKQIGWQHLIIKDGKVTKDLLELHIDLGGIAKGYGLSEAVKALKDQGINSALIEAGGQVHAFGYVDGKPWTVGIRNPRGNGYIAGLAATDETDISTSGDYERFFEKDGVRYHHILDPKTGYPAREIMSVSVITADPTLADAWSTALFIMGPEKALKLAEQKTEIEIIVVDAKGEIKYSQRLPDKLMKK